MSAGHKRASGSKRLSLPGRTALLGVLLLTMPAFYMVLAGFGPDYRHAGHGLYGVVALLMAFELVSRRRAGQRHGAGFLLDAAIGAGALASAWPMDIHPSNIEWVLRLAYSALVFLRMVSLVLRYVALHRVLQIGLLALGALAASGAAFYWVDPAVHSYGDGLWLAFITGATVGYGDVVPSTPASRVLAGFIVVMGYALFSVLTARIAALLVGEDEKRLRHDMHADMRLLRQEIEALRGELRVRDAAGQSAPR